MPLSLMGSALAAVVPNIARTPASAAAARRLFPFVIIVGILHKLMLSGILFPFGGSARGGAISSTGDNRKCRPWALQYVKNDSLISRTYKARERLLGAPGRGVFDRLRPLRGAFTLARRTIRRSARAARSSAPCPWCCAAARR